MKQATENQCPECPDQLDYWVAGTGHAWCHKCKKSFKVLSKFIGYSDANDTFYPAADPSVKANEALDEIKYLIIYGWQSLSGVTLVSVLSDIKSMQKKIIKIIETVRESK